MFNVMCWKQEENTSVVLAITVCLTLLLFERKTSLFLEAVGFLQKKHFCRQEVFVLAMVIELIEFIYPSAY